MKKRNIVILVAVIVFVVLFAARFGFEYTRAPVVWRGQVYEPQPQQMNAVFDQVAQSSSGMSATGRKNYASAKMEIPQAGMASQSVEQKYERVSDISSSSTAWDKDTAAIQAVIRESSAIVQSEDSNGLEGARTLTLELGVVPDKFDPTVAMLKVIGKLQNILITKTDRTADYKALEASRMSLEKTRDGLAALRNAGAELKDRIDLESRILEIEGQIQDLGVSLGDFNENNSFCTIRMTLFETQAVRLGARILPAALASLSWTVKVYLGLAVSVLCILGIAALVLKVLEMIQRQRSHKPVPVTEPEAK